MNASRQRFSADLLSLVAQIAVLFRAEFAGAVPDFNPWLTDAETEAQADPTSVDISFALPRSCTHFASYCILMRVKFSDRLRAIDCRLSTIELTGYDYKGQRWQFTTAHDWQFKGEQLPTVIDQQKLYHICRQIFSLFSYPARLRIDRSC
ncbi:MAG: hypothetical protein AAF766_16745 [Cyanobacteria bacterium P01_D01_bin.14]